MLGGGVEGELGAVALAFDALRAQPQYVAASRVCVKAWLREFSNFLLYNYTDTPAELYQGPHIEVDLCEGLVVSIYSFPMKYHPLRKRGEMQEDYSHARNHIGAHWSRRHIRAVQTILIALRAR